MIGSAWGERLCELEVKLRKSEQQRQKLRDNLKFFKEKAANTQELLRQHVELQAEAERKDCELLQLKLARQGLQTQLEAMQTTSEATASAEPERQGSSSMDTIRLLTARIDRVQQISQDAKGAAQAAAAASRRAEHEVLTLQKQNAQLRDRIKDLEGKQKAAADDLRRMKVQSAALGDREHLKRTVDGLQRQLSTFTEQQQKAHKQLGQWQQAFGAFAQHVVLPPPLGSAPVSHGQRLSDREAAAEAPHEHGQVAKRVCRVDSRAQVKGSSRGSVPNRPAAGSGTEGTALHMACCSEGEQTSIGTVAGPDGAGAGLPTALQLTHARALTPPQDSSSSRAVQIYHTGILAAPDVTHLAAGAPPVHQLQRGRALESSASGTALDKEVCPPSAMDIVEAWLGQLQDKQGAAEASSSVAAGLAAATHSDACLVPCVIAGFQNALLRAAAPCDGQTHKPSRRPEAADVMAADVSCSAGPEIQLQQHSNVCAVLLCALEVSQRLSAGGGEGERLLALLEEQLQQGALHEEPPWEEEACLMSSACAHLFRLQGKQQALRVLLYDMLMSQDEVNAQLLLRISAALAAWPLAVHPTPEPDNLLGQAALAALQDLCSEVIGKEAGQADDAETAADTETGTSSAIALQPGVLNAAQTIVHHLWPEQLHKTEKCWAAQPQNREWAHLKGVFDHALRRGMGMAQGAEQAVAAEEQWHALACTVQLAVHCLGIAYCSTQAKEHGILDTLKAVMQNGEASEAVRGEKQGSGAVLKPSGEVVELEVENF